MSLETVLAALEPYNVKRTYNGWISQCPSHDDNKASLTVAKGDGGKALLKCMAGCETVDVVEAIGLTMADLFEPETAPGKPKIVATYSYYDERGKLLYEVCRFDPKDFRQRRPDGNGGYIWKLEDTRRVLYRLPELIAAPANRTVYIVEGEKDADNLAAIGCTATTSLGGAGKWKSEYTPFFAGRRVVILPDNDEPGRAYARQVQAAISSVAASVTILELPGLLPKGDVSDWIASGESAAALERLIPSGNTKTAEAFKSSAERITGERVARLADTSRILKFGVSYLDDALGGITPYDLILFGAKTGVGKTELATTVALHNCQSGRRVHFFGLEAEILELERRMKYRVISTEYYRNTAADRAPIRYLDWRDGKLDAQLGSYEAMGDMEMKRALRNLYTFYPESSFTADGFCRQLQEIRNETDLVILDHLHYVDNDDADENRGYKAMVKQIKHAAVGLGKPVIVVAHIRKSDRSNKVLIPDIEDFHGSSDIPKIATKAVMIAPALDQPFRASHLWPTYIQIAKCRPDSSVTRYTSLVSFNARTNSYDADYTIGKIAYDQEERAHRFQYITGDETPAWAAPGSNRSGL